MTKQAVERKTGTVVDDCVDKIEVAFHRSSAPVTRVNKNRPHDNNEPARVVRESSFILRRNS